MGEWDDGYKLLLQIIRPFPTFRRFARLSDGIVEVHLPAARFRGGAFCHILDPGTIKVASHIDHPIPSQLYPTLGSYFSVIRHGNARFTFTTHADAGDCRGSQELDRHIRAVYEMKPL